jgi:hypothetical protein
MSSSDLVNAIYSFLIKNKYLAAAKKLKKEIKVENVELDLELIFKKGLEVMADGRSASSGSDTGSSDSEDVSRTNIRSDIDNTSDTNIPKNLKRPRTDSPTLSEPLKTPKRFSRVDAASVEFSHESLKNNSFSAASHAYGLQAHQDLIVTKGKGFRKEKDKKKRGSYRGGSIDFQTRSFKFESDGE